MLDPDRYERFFREFYERSGVVVDSAFVARLQDELMDTFESELEDEWEDLARALIDKEASPEVIAQRIKQNRRSYMKELRLLQMELIKLQDWVVQTGQKVVILFEGRDAAGKGGVIKRITERLNPRVARVVALNKPTREEQTQWYFQRYVRHLPSAGQIILFDRSWYNRSGVERVMGFASEEQVEEFFRTVPLFEEMLIGSGIRLVKYWFSVSDQEQEFRFLCRIHDPLKQWKLSPMDFESRVRWEAYTKAKEEMMQRTNTEKTPWHIVLSNDKKRARLNCIAHLLSLFPYEEIGHAEISLPPRAHHEGYRRMTIPPSMIVPMIY